MFSGYSRSVEADLVEYLRRGYQTTARPVIRGDQAVNVSITFSLNKLIDLVNTLCLYLYHSC